MMYEQAEEKKFKTEKEAIKWLADNGFLRVRNWWINNDKNAEIQALPATKRFVVIINQYHKS
jgi:hypothetical protein